MNTLENKNMVETTNGMTAKASTLNDCVNLFFQIGAMRGKDKTALLTMFSCFGQETLEVVLERDKSSETF
jgi:hypothetical protein